MNQNQKRALESLIIPDDYSIRLDNYELVYLSEAPKDLALILGCDEKNLNKVFDIYKCKSPNFKYGIILEKLCNSKLD